MTRRTLVVGAAVFASAFGLAAWTSPRGSNEPASDDPSASTSTLDPVAASSQSKAALATDRVPFDPQQTAKTVAFWQGRVRDDPQSGLGWSHLAGAFLALARESGDSAHALRAERAARSALKILPTHAEARYRLARSLMTQHRFPEALAALKNTAPDDVQAQRLKADLFLELGDYSKAERALAMSPPERDDANHSALSARLLEARGRTELSLRVLRAATVQAESNPNASPESVAWYHVREARGLALAARHDEARRHLERALQIFPRDYRAMSALAHLGANEHRWDDALKWGERAAAIVPEPETIALLGDVHAAMGQRAQAQQKFQVVQAMSRLARSQGVTHDRQRALFLANHGQNLDEALALARGEMKLRRDIYTYDTLAWAAYKMGFLNEARAASRRALALNTGDAMLWYHAGVIAGAQGDRAEATRLLTRALAINPRFHPSAPAHARGLLAKYNA